MSRRIFSSWMLGPRLLALPLPALLPLVALLLVACRHPTADSSRDARPAATRRSDVTFLVVSDTHFGFGYPDDDALTADPVAQPLGLDEQNKTMLVRMNAIAGRAYPSDFGGAVAAPRGLLITGDLTEWGKEAEWNRFVAYFGLTGVEGLAKFPIYEAVGNHDKIPGPWVEEQVAKRHGRRFYSWTWDDLHFVALSEAPDDEGLDYLRADLAKLAANVPVILYFHLPLAGPWSENNWFGEGSYRDRLAKIIEGHRIAAIFHGHHHANGHYEWHGVNVYKPGAVKNSTNTFTVAHYTDGQLDVAFYDYERDAWVWWTRQKVK